MAGTPKRRVHRPCRHVRWASSDLAKDNFPLLRRSLRISQHVVCSDGTRPEIRSAESERDFSAMTLLLSPLRRGRTAATTTVRVERLRASPPPLPLYLEIARPLETQPVF